MPGTTIMTSHHGNGNGDGNANGRDYGSTTSVKAWLPVFHNSNSASNNTNGSYQSVPSNENDDITGPPPPPPAKELLSFESDSSNNHKVPRLLVKILKVAIVVVVLWLIYDYCIKAAVFGPNKNKNNNIPDDDAFSYQYVTDDQYDNTIAPPAAADHHTKKKERKPFSTVHPVQLGVPQLSRPENSRPSIVLTHHSQATTTTATKSQHFPTNAWYQNMLLITDTTTLGKHNETVVKAEPSELNRVYATPFLVDAVGPVPGVRIIPNQVSASTSVIQINDIVEYGLTVGAGPNFATPSMIANNKKKNTKTKTQNNDSTRKLKSHQELTKKGSDKDDDDKYLDDSSSSSSSSSSGSSGSSSSSSSSIHDKASSSSSSSIPDKESTGEDGSSSSSSSSTTTTTTTTAATASPTDAPTPRTFSHEYRVERTTPLGLTLGWGKTYPMQSSIVKGMPYGTMVYETTKYEVTLDDNDNDDTDDKDSKQGGKSEIWYPTVASQIPLAKAPIVDGNITLACLGGEIFTTAPTTTATTSSEATSGTLKSSGSADSSTTTSGSEPPQAEDEGEQYQVKVEREIELHFADSDFTWLVFVSRPVTVQCVVNQDTRSMQLQVIDDDATGGGSSATATEDNDDEHNDNGETPPFVIRIALAKFCTSNKNPIYCHREQLIPYSLDVGQGRYEDLLRNHSSLAPGPNANFEYDVDETKQQINIVFDWDARDIANYNAPLPASAVADDQDAAATATLEHGLIAFALSHHLDLMGTRYAPGYLKYCATTLIGPACMLAGSKWKMVETLPQIDLRAPRPIAPWAIQALAKSATKDIHFKLSKFYQTGAGDTYFSGKMLAKLARILAVVEELKELCGQRSSGDESIAIEYQEACHGATLPSDKDVRKAVAVLRSAVEVWLNGKAVTPFVYDDAWGGVVSCGCNNPDGGLCRNKFPECPSFTDPGLNFGNAFYNDLHFHYGYHIHAAAVLSHFDPAWGKKFFERVLLLVRNIANPSDSGDYFPAFRHKDWYQGHSWASGVVPPYLNGRNQESSSEAIAAYEAVALYGVVMKKVFDESSEGQNHQVAREIEKAGQVLTATELRSTRRYYHVRDQGNANGALKIYPREYTNHAIGMMWNTMAQYQTWFGGKPYLAVGIQLLPITPIAEQRDGVVWLGEMYPSFAETCSANKDCEENGWSVLQLASLATIGYQEEAAKGATALSPDVFASAGGNGHSLTNTLWYIATRPVVDEPIKIGNVTKSDTSDQTSDTGGHDDTIHVLTNCYVPEVCTDYVLDTIADEYSCRQRMTNLMDATGLTQMDACYTVAKIQFPEQCGACVPNATESSKTYRPQCPPCTVDQCGSDLNRCPQFSQTFVCSEGPNKGGCSRFPWDVRSAQCTACCELTECFK